jgi:hypothetical protein
VSAVPPPELAIPPAHLRFPGSPATAERQRAILVARNVPRDGGRTTPGADLLVLTRAFLREAGVPE